MLGISAVGISDHFLGCPYCVKLKQSLLVGTNTPVLGLKLVPHTHLKTLLLPLPSHRPWPVGTHLGWVLPICFAHLASLPDPCENPRKTERKTARKVCESFVYRLITRSAFRKLNFHSSLFSPLCPLRMFGIYIVSQCKSMSSLFLADTHDGGDCYSSSRVRSGELATGRAGNFNALQMGLTRIVLVAGGGVTGWASSKG